MTIEPAALIAGLGIPVLAPVLVFLRVSSAFFFLPGFGEQMVPMRVRLALAFAFTAIVWPAVAAEVPRAGATGQIVVLAAGEMLIGLVLGLAIRLVYVGLQIAGVIAAQATSLSQLLGAEAIDPQPALSALLMLSGLTLAMSLGLGLRIAEMFILLYRALPPGSVLGGADSALWVSRAIAATFELAVLLSAPFLIMSLLYNLGLGVINKAMPQLMVAFVGAPAITLATIMLLVVAAPILLMTWVEVLSDRLDAPFGTGR